MKAWVVLGLLVLGAAGFYTDPQLMRRTFDAVYWTEDVAAAESELRAALPTGAAPELWLAGEASPEARAALQSRGWTLRSASVAAGTPPAG